MQSLCSQKLERGCDGSVFWGNLSGFPQRSKLHSRTDANVQTVFWSRWAWGSPCLKVHGLNWSSFLRYGISGFVSLPAWPGTQAAEHAPGKAATFKKKSGRRWGSPSTVWVSHSSKLGWSTVYSLLWVSFTKVGWADPTCSLAWLKGSTSPHSSPPPSPACIWMCVWLLPSSQLWLSVCPWWTDS